MAETLFGDPIRKPHRPAMAAQEGTGPEGETCGTCKHLCRVQHNDYCYKKCGLMQQFWTRGAGTDIRCKWAACKFWEPQPTLPERQGEQSNDRSTRTA